MQIRDDEPLLVSKDVEEIIGFLIHTDQQRKKEIEERFGEYADADLQALIDGYDGNPVRVPYAELGISTPVKMRPKDISAAYGFLPRRGIYSGSVTQIAMMQKYFRHNIKSLINNTNRPFEVRSSRKDYIPLLFALTNKEVFARISPEKADLAASFFHTTELKLMSDASLDVDDSILLGDFLFDKDCRDIPLLPFTASRVDDSIARIPHYFGNDASHVQEHVIFTNYPMYEKLFTEFGMEMMSGTDDALEKKRRSEFVALVEPGGRTTYNQNLCNRLPEGINDRDRYDSAAYHLKRADGSGITLVNIGQGASNSVKIAQLLGPLRSRVWIMLGHAGGLHDTMRVGDYVLASGYIRDTPITQRFMPNIVDIGEQAEVHRAFMEAIKNEFNITDPQEIKRRVRKGKVLTVDLRLWEHRLRAYAQLVRTSRAIAADMESGVLATMAKFYGIAFGTFLCVSDTPIQGGIKLPGMSDSFYTSQRGPHFRIAIRAIEDSLRRDKGLISRQNLPPIFAPGFR
jgi:AMP nucleosidase